VDINILREIATVASLVTFVGIWAWAWSRRNRAGLEEAGRIPFQQDE
jgi:cytochrome c oxidase cbb3-type subunit 4